MPRVGVGLGSLMMGSVHVPGPERVADVMDYSSFLVPILFICSLSCSSVGLGLVGHFRQCFDFSHYPDDKVQIRTFYEPTAMET